MRARLRIEVGDGEPNELDLVPESAVTVGRSRDNTVVVRDEHASRMHARLFFDEGHWRIRDFSMNGTLLNGERIQQQAELEHGTEVRIGNTRMRFVLLEPATTSTFRPSSWDRSRPSSTSMSGLSITGNLPKEDLTLLTTFMAAGTASTEPSQLLRQGLELLLARTNAYVVGCLGADPADPIEKVVLPPSASIDPAMSRHLTRRALRDGRTFWLGTDISDSRPKDSLKEVTDALCVPMRCGGLPRSMLHLYKKGEFFSERDVRLAEALADFLDGCMQAMRRERVSRAEIDRLHTHPPIVDELVGDSPAMVRLRQRVHEAAASRWPVLIRAEAGTCADQVALSLHQASARSSGPMVAVPLATIAPPLMESELFGKIVGAAEVQSGYCQRAEEGTLFLDEVKALTPDAQSRLQSLLTEKTIRPVGALTEYRFDVRVVASTHSDLEMAAAAGKFRKSLLGCLSHEVIEIPPLRTHLEDIPYLVQYFMDRLAMETHRTITLTPAAIDKLQSYSWPGNLRQLRAELEAAVFRSSDEVIDSGDILQDCERFLVVRNYAGSSSG